MKLRIGGSLSYRIQFGQFEPSEISSTIEIEDDINETDLETRAEELQQKVDLLVDKDIKKKISKAFGVYKEIKETLKTI